MKIAAIVQARTASTRLPGKVLMKLPYAGELTVLEQVIMRLKRCVKLDDIVIATTTDQKDERIVDIAQRQHLKSFRGSSENVLSRYYAAAKEYGIDVIVRITGDCPCIDPEVVDLVVIKHISTRADFTSNTLNRTFPHGLDTEVLNFDSLEKAHLQAKENFEREHVCPYIYKSNPQMFKICGVEAPEKFRGKDIRITLDTKADYVLLCAVFDYLYPQNKFFGAEAVIKLFHEKPWLRLINEEVIHKKIFDSLESELIEAVRVMDLQGFKRAKDILIEHLP